MLERVSIDEAYVDATDLADDELRRRARDGGAGDWAEASEWVHFLLLTAYF